MTNVPVQITRDGKLANPEAEFNRPKTCLYRVCFGGDNDPIMDLLTFHGEWPMAVTKDYTFDAHKKMVIEKSPCLSDSTHHNYCEYILGKVKTINPISQLAEERPGYTHLVWIDKIEDALYCKDRVRKFFRTNCKYAPSIFLWHIGFNDNGEYQADKVGFRQSASFPDHMSSCSAFFRHMYYPDENIMKIYFSNSLDEGLELYEFGKPKESIFPKEKYQYSVWFNTTEAANAFVATLQK
ncbi:MAG: hypothetical protein WCP93_01410 [Candidatus Berkelbacteria bacterium]